MGEQTAPLPAVAHAPPEAGQARRAAKWLLLGPILPGTWRALSNLLASLAASAAFAAAGICALAGGLAWLVALLLRAVAFGRKRTAGSWMPLLSAAIRVSAQLTGLDRARIRYLTGNRIEAVPWPRPVSALPLGQRQRAWLESPVARRAALYQLARLPAVVAAGTAVAGACALMTAGLSGNLHSGGREDVLALPIGIACVFVWPVIARLGSALDVALARALLGPSRAGQLTREVQHLGEARAHAVQSADSERRRIERDLHDGLQPRLVSLALELGIARSRFERDPDYARSLLEQAHEEAKVAIQDLRSLVRGIHPSVLDERGLDAALSALVASCAVPVRVDVRLTRRPDRPREAVAYFVASEAITNVTKHSGASAASVTITDDGELLRVFAEDDGKGGAVIDPGGGLAGLAARVAAIDGTFTVASPPGGPTLVSAVLPCGR